MRVGRPGKELGEAFRTPTLLTEEAQDGQGLMLRQRSRRHRQSWKSQVFILEAITGHSHKKTGVTYNVLYFLTIFVGKQLLGLDW